MDEEDDRVSSSPMSAHGGGRVRGERKMQNLGTPLTSPKIATSFMTTKTELTMSDTGNMNDHVYKILELGGSSEKGIEDAIQNAISRASKTIRNISGLKSPRPEDISRAERSATIKLHCGLAYARGITPNSGH
jgi:hypothetical protein